MGILSPSLVDPEVRVQVLFSFMYVVQVLLPSLCTCTNVIFAYECRSVVSLCMCRIVDFVYACRSAVSLCKCRSVALYTFEIPCAFVTGHKYQSHSVHVHISICHTHIIAVMKLYR